MSETIAIDESEVLTTPEQFAAAVRAAARSGRWMIRSSDNGESFGGFRWSQQGEWTVAPDWDPAPVCGGGLHGQSPLASGFRPPWSRLEFCETGDQVAIDDDKVKTARQAQIEDLHVDKDRYATEQSICFSKIETLKAVIKDLKKGKLND